MQTLMQRLQAPQRSPQRTTPLDPERQRGLRSFLTWAFVLSEVIGKGVLPESTAKAAVQDGISVDQASRDQDTTISDPSGSESFRPAPLDESQEEDSASPSGLRAHLPDASAHEAAREPEMSQPAAPKPADIVLADGGEASGDETELVHNSPQGSAPSQGSAPPQGSDASGPTGSDGGDTSTSAHTGPVLGFEVTLGPDGVFIGTESHLPEVANLGSQLIQTVGSEVADLTHFLQSALPGITGIPELSSTVATLASTLSEVTGLEVLGVSTKSIIDVPLPQQLHNAVSAVAPLDGLLGSILPLANAGYVSSGSIPTVPSTEHLDRSDQLYTVGGHTEYGLTLQLSSATADAASTGGSTSSTPPGLDQASAALGVLHDGTGDQASHPLHFDELNLRSLSM